MSEIRRKLLSQADNDKGFFIAISVQSTSAPNNVCYSYDSGKNWTVISKKAPIINTSKDLSVWTLAQYNGDSQFTIDGGITFNPLPIFCDYATVSKDGSTIIGVRTSQKKVYKMPYPFTSYQQVATSSNDLWVAPTIDYNGVFWGFRSGPGGTYKFYENSTLKNTFTISASDMNISQMGSKSNIIYIPTTNGLYRSEDRGQTFQLINNTNVVFGWDGGNRNVSEDGKYLFNTQNKNYIALSTDYGQTLIQTYISGSGRMRGAVSSSGKYMTYSNGYDGVYISTDYGTKFNKLPLPSNLSINSADLMSVYIEDIP